MAFRTLAYTSDFTEMACPFFEALELASCVCTGNDFALSPARVGACPAVGWFALF